MNRIILIFTAITLVGCGPIVSQTGDIWYCADARSPHQYIVIDDLPGDSVDWYIGYHHDDEQGIKWVGRSVPDIPLDSLLNGVGLTGRVSRRNSMRPLLDSIRKTGVRGRR